MGKRHVVIIGSGIIGLAVATELAQNEEFKITIFTKHLPSDYDESLMQEDGYMYDYTSLWAGAHFRPFPYTTYDTKRLQVYADKTFEKFKEISKSNPESTIRFMEGYDFIENPSDGYKNFHNGYNRPYCRNIESVNHPSDRIKFGAKYDAWSVNSPELLKFLFKILQRKSNVKFVKRAIRSLVQIAEEFEDDLEFYGIIDCSGRGIQFKPVGNNINDPKVFSIRGQTLLIQSKTLQKTSYYNKTITYQTINKETGYVDWTFIIPRPPLSNGIFILGGTKQANTNDPVIPTSEDTFALLSRAKEFFPEIFDHPTAQYKIIKKVVGFRPAREGGFRLDKQVIKTLPGKSLLVVSCYGAGGSGYEISFGAAAEVKKLLEAHSKEGASKL